MQNSGSWCVIVVFALLLLICFFVVSFANLLPNEIQNGGTAVYYVDWLFWIGNNISMEKSFPVYDYRLYGTSFNYHYFSSIFLAYSSMVTDIDPTILGFYYSPLIPVFLMTAFSYLLISSLVKNKYLKIIALICILFTEGTTITYVWHILFCPFGYDYGYAFGMASVLYLIYFNREEFSISFLILTIISIALCTGSKGPVSVVILIAFGIDALSKLLMKNNKGFLYGILWLASFVVIYFVFVKGDYTAISAQKLFIGDLKNAFLNNRFEMSIYYNLINRFPFLNKYILAAITSVIYIFQSNPSAITLFVVGTIHFLRNLVKKSYDIINLEILSITVWGILLTLISYQQGGSQMYFVMSTIPFSITLGFQSLEKINKRNKKMLAGFVICIGFLMGFYNWNKIINNRIEYSLNYYEKKTMPFTNFSLTKEEYEAYKWLSDHSETNAIVAVDTFNSHGFDSRMTAGVFTERYIWNDGKYSSEIDELERRNDIVNRIMNGDYKALYALKDEGVDFFVDIIDEKQIDSINASIDLECVYKNQQVVIYECK